MARPVVLMLAVAALMGGVASSQAGPCSTQIAQVEQQVSALQAAPPASGAGEPTAPQTLGAQLHHQPTPGSVEHGEHIANADADAALDRARKADAENNADDCEEALRRARHLYGID
jgi:hypothetical protein